MSNLKEEINLDINTELTEDEFEYNSTDNNIIDLDDSNENITEMGLNNDSLLRSDTYQKGTFSDTFDYENSEVDTINYNINTDKTLRIPDDKRISRNILTKYEYVRLLGTRAKQISDGSKVFVKYDGAKSAMELAELELKYKMIPLKIKRPLPNGKYEIWKLSELEILDF